MSYIDLIENIFGEKRECISERDFLQKLPKLLENRSRYKNQWSSENLAFIVIKKDGVGEDKRTFKDIADHFGVSVYTIRRIYSYALRLLRSPFLVKEYVTKLDETETSYLQELDRLKWKASLSHSAHSVLKDIRIQTINTEFISYNAYVDDEKDYVKILFDRPPIFKNRKVIFPTISGSDIVYESLRMSLSVFNEIREAVGIDPFEPPKKKPTASEISRAVKLLESEGYVVKKSKNQPQPPKTR